MLKKQAENPLPLVASNLGSFAPDVTAWARLALSVRDDLGEPAEVTSVGVPTWFYGQEPPNVFAGAIAKFFSNALREDGLLARCTHGVVYLPGAAGTVQEVFPAVTGHYYPRRPTAPLVLVGRAAWAQDLPVWPLLSALAQDRPMASTIHLVDSVEEAAGVFSR